MADINTVAELDEAIANGPYAWPGGYPIYYLTDDGGALSHASVVAEREGIADSIENGSNDGWRVVAVDVNWEDPDLYDDHSGERIESAYAEDDSDDED